MQEARIELLQRMPIFGGIRADTLEFLLSLLPDRAGRRERVLFPRTSSKATRCSSWRKVKPTC